MTRKELIDNLQETLNTKYFTDIKLSKADMERILNGLSDVVTDAVKNDGEVKLPNLGTLCAVDRAARTARNPQTGEPITIAARKGIKFKASKTLKDSIN